MRLTRILVATLLMVATTTAIAQTSHLLLAPTVVGSSVYSVRDFAPAISANVGRPTSPRSIDTLREAITRRYVQDGYISPIIAVPPEDLGSATPRIYIYEARLLDVVIRGNAGPYRSRILAALNPLRGRALRKEPLRQALLQISELPGITSQPIFDLQPGMPNSFVLVLSTRYVPVSGEIDVNNGGTSELGNALYSASLFLNDVLGAGEQMQLRGATSSLFDRYQFEDAKILHSLGDSQVFLEAAHSEAVPDSATHFADENATIGLNRALIERRGGVLKLVGWFQEDDSVIHDADEIHVTDDRIRSIAIGFEFDSLNSPSPTSLYSTVVRGINALGAGSLDASDSEIQVAFTKYLLGLSRSVPLGPLWIMHFNVDAQASADVLPLVERFAFGGLGMGEAFDPASLVGDSGAAATLELGRALPLHWNALQSATAYAKADYGVAWSNASYLPRRDDAASLSIGVLGKWPHTILTVELSTPVHQPTYAPPASSVRALASIAVTF